MAVLIYCHLYTQCTELTIRTKINFELSSQSHSHRASQQRTYATRAFHRVMQISDAHNNTTQYNTTTHTYCFNYFRLNFNFEANLNLSLNFHLFSFVSFSTKCDGTRSKWIGKNFVSHWKSFAYQNFVFVPKRHQLPTTD